MKALHLLKKGNTYWKRQALILTLFIGSTTAGAVLPFLIREFIDALLDGTGLLMDMALLIFAVGSLSSFFGFLGNYLFQILAMEGVKDLQIDIYSKIQKAPIRHILKEKTGDILSRITSDTQLVGQIIAIGVPMVLLNVVQFCVVVVVLAALDLQLAVVTFVSVPAYYVVFRTYNKRLRLSTQKERQAFGRVVESLREKLQGLITIKLYNAQNVFQNQVAEDVGSWFLTVKKKTLHSILSVNLIGYITSIMPLLVFLVGGYRVMAGALTVGTLVGFWQYMGRLYDPIRGFAEWNNVLQQSVSTGERISYFLEMEKERLGESTLPREPVKITADEVSFSYNGEKALDSVTFTIEPGSIVAVVGGSGSGKTTLLKLLMAFYLPDTGEILINEKQIQQYDLTDLRDVISYVQQKDFIFNTTIRENIAMGLTIPDEKIAECSKCCLLHDFLENLPQKYDTTIGERGLDLSDGQKQRIAIARALIREPCMLILDEATSALDSERETQILKNIKQKLKGTVIVVSHRLSTILIADKILVFEAGQVVGEGVHEVLKKENEQYNRLFKEQLIECPEDIVE